MSHDTENNRGISLCFKMDNMTDDQSDQNLVAKIPPLPEGKIKHFFVSYNSQDKDKVYSVVDELEKRFGLTCVYDERDFQGGKDISVNILEGIKSSLKVLIFLTPNFLQSGWCKYETDAAFVTSMGCGYSCIVPVVLEECEIPPTLVTLTYIDATVPGMDVPTKIASTLLRPDSDDCLFPLNIRTYNKIFENGYCYVIPAERDNVCVYRPARYYFKVDDVLLEKLKENKVEVPETLFAEAIELLNKESVMKSYDYLSRCKNFVWSLFLLPLFCLVYGLTYNITILKLGFRKRTDAWEELGIVMYLTYPGFLLSLIVMIEIFLCFLPAICHRKKRDVSLQSKLWKKIGKQCIENNVLLFFTSRRNKLPTLNVMRYNIARCKEYFVGVVRSRNLLPVDRTLSPEAYVDILIERHLEENASTLVDNFDLLPDAPYNRHNVKKGKMCICQQLENNL